MHCLSEFNSNFLETKANYNTDSLCITRSLIQVLLIYDTFSWNMHTFGWWTYPISSLTYDLAGTIVLAIKWQTKEYHAGSWSDLLTLSMEVYDTCPRYWHKSGYWAINWHIKSTLNYADNLSIQEWQCDFHALVFSTYSIFHKANAMDV